MSSSSVPSPTGDLTGLTSAAASEDLAIASEQSGPEAVRRAHLREEAYVKAVGRVNYLYAVLFGAYSAYFIRLTFLHVSGAISAAWSVRPGWIALQVDACVTATLALIAGYGFRRLKPWALWVEAFVVPCCLAFLPASIFAYSKLMGLGYIAAGVSLLTALLVPLLYLLDSIRSDVFSPEYRRVIAATPGVRVRAKLPWELKLPALLFLAIYLIICTSMAAI